MASNKPIAQTAAPRLSKYFGKNRIHSSSAKPMDTSAASRMAVFRLRAKNEVRLLAKEGENIATGRSGSGNAGSGEGRSLETGDSIRFQTLDDCSVLDHGVLG